MLLDSATAELFLQALKCLLPILVVGIVLTVHWTNGINSLAIRLAGSSQLLDTETDACEDSVSNAARKSKRETSASHLSDPPVVNPRMGYIALAYALVALSYFPELAAAIVRARASTGSALHGWYRAEVITPVISAAVFACLALTLLFGERLQSTEALHLRVIAWVATLTQVAIIGSQLCLLLNSLVQGLHIVVLPIVLDVLRLSLFSLALATFSSRLAITTADFGDGSSPTANGQRLSRPRDYGVVTICKRLRRFLPFMAPLRDRGVQLLVAMCVLLALATNAVNPFTPIFTGKIVGDLASGTMPWRNILIWACLRGSVGFGGLLPATREILWRPIEQRASRDLSRMAFDHVLQLSAKFHNDKKSSEVINIVERSLAASRFLSFAVFDLGPTLVDVAIGISYLTAMYGIAVSVILSATAVAFFAAASTTRARQAQLRTANLDRTDDVSSVRSEALSNAELVRCFAAEAYESLRYRRALDKQQQTTIDSLLLVQITSFSESQVTNIGIMLGALVVARQISLGQKSIGDFVIYTSYATGVLGRITQLKSMQRMIDSMMTATDKLMDLLDQPQEVVDKPDAVELYQATGHIEFENVTFSYDKLPPVLRNAGNTKDHDVPTRDALRNVSFSISPGQHVALVGASGGGKSTIFKLLFRFFDVQEGSIKVDGKDIREYTQRSLRSALGMVQQESSLFNDTIMANIKYGDITASPGKVIDVTKQAQIYDRITEFPKKFESVVGERGVRLSGGEKQRVSIARTLLKNPDVLLLDEATASLDTATEKDIQAQLRDLTKGKTTIAIAHRLSTISRSDLILVLDKGQIVETGTHADLIQKPEGQYAKLWQAQIEGGAVADEELASM